MSVVEQVVTVPEVSRGAAWLDENAPGWWERIDLESLDLRSCELCICGQLALVETLRGEDGFSYPEDLGMDLPRLSQPPLDVMYHELQLAWEAEILWRREVA